MISQAGDGGQHRSKTSVLVRGAGIVGLWQAITFLEGGDQVTLVDVSPEPFRDSASQYAGAMIAPYCERESADPLIADLGERALSAWKDRFDETIAKGSLVVAPARDQSELSRFAAATHNFRRIDRSEIGELEPDLAGRFSSGLFFPEEAHVETRRALPALLDRVKALGGDVRFDVTARISSQLSQDADIVIDCTGWAARSTLGELRGVRGEMALIRSHDVHLTRPIRLAHPRFPVYVVPWRAGEAERVTTYMVGASMIERDGNEPVRVRSALDLLGAAYAVHPGLGEAEIVKLGSGVRPAFPDNLPKVVLRDDAIYVNGMYRHGFLLAPVLADFVWEHVTQDRKLPESLTLDHRFERQV